MFSQTPHFTYDSVVLSLSLTCFDQRMQHVACWPGHLGVVCISN